MSKYRLKDLLHRSKRIDLKMDIIEDEVIVRDAIVGWVVIRGQTDPVYIEETQQYLQANAMHMGKDPTPEETRKGYEYALNAAVACAITSWDEDFFGEAFSVQAGMDIFKDIQYVSIYNQIAVEMQQVQDFLPIATQLPLSG